MGSPALFSGSFVKFLKASLNLGDQAYVIPGTSDPTSVAVLAPASSLYLRSSPSIDVSYNTGSGAGSGPGFVGKWGNVFTATATATITEASVRTLRNGSATGNLFMRVLTVIGGVPQLPVLASSDPVPVNSANLDAGGTNFQSLSFTFSTPFQLQSGTQYFLSYDFSNQSTPVIFIDRDGSSPAGYVGWENGFGGGTGDTYNLLGLPISMHLRTQQAGSGLASIYVKQDAGSTTNWLQLASGNDAKALEIEMAYRDKHEDSPFQLMTMNIFDQKQGTLISAYLGATPASYSSATGAISFTSPGSAGTVLQNLSQTGTVQQIYSEYYQGNTFTTPTSSVTVNSISIDLSANGNTATNNVVVKLWATSSNTPTTLIATSNPIALNTLTGSLTAFTFPSPPILSGSTRYAWTVEIDNLVPDPITAPFPFLNTHAAASTEYFVQSLNSGTTWQGSTLANNIAHFSVNYQTSADGIVSTQMLDTVEFLNNPNSILTDITSVDLLATWAQGAIDSAALYAVSRDGGNNWQNLTMVNAGSATDTFYGTLTFSAEPSNQTINQFLGSTSTAVLNTTTTQQIGQKFTLTAATVLQQISFNFAKTGSPSGNFYVSLIADSSGFPSTSAAGILAQSSAQSVSAISNGISAVTIPNTALPAGTYHIVVTTDATYKASYVNSTTQLGLIAGNLSTSAYEVYNGTTWASGGAGTLANIIAGRVLDLRVRVQSGTANTKLLGYAVSYSPNNTNATYARPALQVFQFNSLSAPTTFTITNFTVDSNLVAVDYVEGGQHLVVGQFTVQGQTLVFPANYFNPDGQSRTVTLRINQYAGGTYNTTDFSNSLLAANHLGSTDPTIDRSAAGRGPILRDTGGTLREIELNALGYPVVAVSPGGAVLRDATTASTLDDTAATRLGLKQYLHGTTYNGGIAPTVTGQAGFSNIRSVFIPYQMQDGTWRMRFTCIYTQNSGTVADIAIAGVAFKQIGVLSGGVGPSNTASPQPFFAVVAGAGGGSIIFRALSSAETSFSCTGDVELSSKPIWAY